jgi:hypothetical protein
MRKSIGLVRVLAGGVPALAAFAVLLLASCGGGGGGSPTTPSTAPSTPAVSITAAGEGNMVIHPSLDSRFAFALETPIRITETAGGTADWNFARIQLLRKGQEVERYELGADVIERAGYKRIAARSNQLYTIAFRFNNEDFDDGAVTLGFSDLKDGRQFTVSAADNWADVTISLTPLSVPAEGTVRLDQR